MFRILTSLPRRGSAHYLVLQVWRLVSSFVWSSLLLLGGRLRFRWTFLDRRINDVSGEEVHFSWRREYCLITRACLRFDSLWIFRWLLLSLGFDALSRSVVTLTKGDQTLLHVHACIPVRQRFSGTLLGDFTLLWFCLFLKRSDGTVVQLRRRALLGSGILWIFSFPWRWTCIPWLALTEEIFLSIVGVVLLSSLDRLLLVEPVGDLAVGESTFGLCQLLLDLRVQLRFPLARESSAEADAEENNDNGRNDD